MENNELLHKISLLKKNLIKDMKLLNEIETSIKSQKTAGIIGFRNDALFLLSTEEFEKYKSKIPFVHTWWWLRSEGCCDTIASAVADGHYVETFKYYTRYKGAVRPALKYGELESEHGTLISENSFVWRGTEWTIIDEEKQIAIAKEPLFECVFSHHNNDYENSLVRYELWNWFNKSMPNPYDRDLVLTL